MATRILSYSKTKYIAQLPLKLLPRCNRRTEMVWVRVSHMPIICVIHKSLNHIKRELEQIIVNENLTQLVLLHVFMLVFQI